MKFAITGHTYGIGRGLFDRVGGVGISRSNGYDITNQSDLKRIKAACDDCDVFINNAYDGFGQSQVLLYLFREWYNTDKIIINVGSRVADDGIRLGLDHINMLEYWMHKQSLRSTTEYLVGIETRLQVRYVSFGYVGTEKILAKYPDMTDYISVDRAVDLILEQLV
jgi:hypothetical protein